MHRPLGDAIPVAAYKITPALSNCMTPNAGRCSHTARAAFCHGLLLARRDLFFWLDPCIFGAMALASRRPINMHNLVLVRANLLFAAGALGQVLLVFLFGVAHDLHLSLPHARVPGRVSAAPPKQVWCQES